MNIIVEILIYPSRIKVTIKEVFVVDINNNLDLIGVTGPE